MTDEQERLLEIMEAGIVLGKATLDELRAAHNLCTDPHPTTLHLDDDDMDVFLGDLDYAACKSAAREIIDLVGRLRTAQGWATDKGEQP